MTSPLLPDCTGLAGSLACSRPHSSACRPYGPGSGRRSPGTGGCCPEQDGDELMRLRREELFVSTSVMRSRGAYRLRSLFFLGFFNGSAIKGKRVKAMQLKKKNTFFQRRSSECLFLRLPLEKKPNLLENNINISNLSKSLANKICFS